jgi:hypothetical protein
MGKTKPTVYLIDADCFRVLCRECHTRNMLTRWRRSKNSGGGIAPTAIAASYRGLPLQRQRFPPPTQGIEPVLNGLIRC